MFEGRNLLIATQHGKEKIIAPIFEKEFGTDVAHVIPYYWLPNFVNSTEPSGRELKIYKDLNTELS